MAHNKIYFKLKGFQQVRKQLIDRNYKINKFLITAYYNETNFKLLHQKILLKKMKVMYLTL